MYSTMLCNISWCTQCIINIYSMYIQYICLHIFYEANDSYLLTPSHTQILEMLSHQKIFSVGGVLWWKLIIVSALSLFLREIERKRDRESLTIYCINYWEGNRSQKAWKVSMKMLIIHFSTLFNVGIENKNF